MWFKLFDLYRHISIKKPKQEITITKICVNVPLQNFQTVMKWGKMLRTHYNTKRFTDNDMTLKYIGYWTDAGAFYYYNTEPNITYEKTMIDVKKEAMKEFVSYK